MYQRDEEAIKRALKERYATLEEEGYDVFGVFLFGSQNSNLDDEKSDIDAQGIILLSQEDYKAGKRFTKRVKSKGELLDVQDLGLVLKAIYDCHFSYVELLCTPYYYVNPKYAAAYKQFHKKAPALVAWSPERLMLQCAQENKDTLQATATQYIMPSTPTSRVAKVAALFQQRKRFLEQYQVSYDYWSSFDLSNYREEILSIKRNEPFHSKQYWLDYVYSTYRELQAMITKFVGAYVEYDNEEIRDRFQSFLDEVMQISA